MESGRVILLACLLAGAFPALGRITDATVARDDRAIILIANPFGYVAAKDNHVGVLHS